MCSLSLKSAISASLLLLFSVVLCIETKNPSAVLAEALRLPTRQRQPLLVLLIDSLRWDVLMQYAKKTNKTLTGFSKLKQRSAYVERVFPVFPAECAPNLVSLLTGLYPVDHGAVLPQLFDERRNRTFVVNFGDASGEVALQSMASNLKQRVHMSHLPICSNLSAGPISCDAYSAREMTPERLQANIKSALTRLVNGTSDIVVIYYDRLDQIGHKHGPLSDRLLLDELPALDRVIDHLLESILPSVNQSINMVVTSDHGMTDIRGLELLDRFISPALVTKVINRGATVSIWPAHGRSAELHRRLNSPRIGRFTFYSRDQLPDEWRSGGALFPPILLVAKPGYWLNSTIWSVEGGHYVPSAIVRGAHGYSTVHSDMHVPLFLLGPHIRPGHLNTSNWDQVHTHRLIAALTQFPIDLPHGPIFTMRTMAKDRSFVTFLFALGVFLLSFTALSTIALCVHHYMNRCRRKPEAAGFRKLDL